MTKKNRARRELKGKARLRAEIVEISRTLHKLGAIGSDDLEKTTLSAVSTEP
jgi:hypothetical protein